MKKALLCAAALSCASILFGFDSAETADSVLQKVNEAGQNANGVSMVMDINVDAGISISSEGTETPSTIGVGVNGTFDVAATIEPFAMQMDGAMTLSTFGVNEEIKMTEYATLDDNGTMDMYIYSEDSTSEESGWQHQQTDLGEGFNIKELQAQTADFDYAEWGINWELASAPETVNGAECYVLSTVIDADTLNTILAKTEELSGQSITGDDNVAMVLSMLNGLQLKLVYYVDAATYLPVQLHMDLNDTDLSALDQYVAMAFGDMGEGSEIHLFVNDISVDASTNYEEVPAIVVPADALATAVTDLSEELSSIAG